MTEIVSKVLEDLLKESGKTLDAEELGEVRAKVTEYCEEM